MTVEQLSDSRRGAIPQAVSASLFAGKYRVERVVGRGGMGLVFAARHLRLGHRVAIKVLGCALRGRPEIVRRFEREAAAMARLSSAHAVRVLDADVTDDGVPYFVMELLEGCDLRSVLLRGGPQPMDRAARWVIEACRGIGEAHRNGIVHRDLKPSNLFLANEDGGEVIKILDFGIAKMVGMRDVIDSKMAVGTPPYMAPEQMLSAEAVDERADVWALGVTLYELVTGSLPLAVRPRPGSPRTTIPSPRLLRPSLSEEAAAVVMRALRERHEERYEDVFALADALASVVDRSCRSRPARCRGEERSASLASAYFPSDAACRAEDAPVESTVTSTATPASRATVRAPASRSRAFTAALVAAALVATCRPDAGEPRQQGQEGQEGHDPRGDGANARASVTTTSSLDIVPSGEERRPVSPTSLRSSDAGAEGTGKASGTSEQHERKSRQDKKETVR